MASLNYSTTLYKMVNAYFNGATITAMLLTSAYTPDKDAHDFRADLTASEASGTGYSAGGGTITATVAQDNANDRVTVTFSDPSWAASSVSARYLAIYKDSGNEATDEIITLIDHGSTVTSVNSTFTFDVTAPLIFQN